MAYIAIQYQPPSGPEYLDESHMLMVRFAAAMVEQISTHALPRIVARPLRAGRPCAKSLRTRDGCQISTEFPNFTRERAYRKEMKSSWFAKVMILVASSFGTGNKDPKILCTRSPNLLPNPSKIK
jgi:hypothetical protein